MPLIRPRVNRLDKSISERIMVGAAHQDSVFESMLKWIPIEVLTVYKTVDGVIPMGRDTPRFVFAVAMVPICALWIAFATKPDHKAVAWRQVILSPIAFACWVIAMQSTDLMKMVPKWESWIGSLVLGCGTLLLPILDGALKALGIRQN